LPEHRRCGSEGIIEKEEVMNSFSRQSENNKNRREFLRNGMVAAGAATLGTGLLASGAPVLAEQEKESSGKLSRGDAAIQRFLAAAEILETDLWVQYKIGRASCRARG